jgi:hypothetical protein
VVEVALVDWTGALDAAKIEPASGVVELWLGKSDVVVVESD